MRRTSNAAFKIDEQELSLYKRIKLRIFNQVYIDHRTRSGWRGPLPFYAFRCPVHGLVFDYPHGYENRLDCPKCNREDELLRVFQKSF